MIIFGEPDIYYSRIGVVKFLIYGVTSCIFILYGIFLQQYFDRSLYKIVYKTSKEEVVFTFRL